MKGKVFEIALWIVVVCFAIAGLLLGAGATFGIYLGLMSNGLVSGIWWTCAALAAVGCGLMTKGARDTYLEIKYHV